MGGLGRVVESYFTNRVRQGHVFHDGLNGNNTPFFLSPQAPFYLGRIVTASDNDIWMKVSVESDVPCNLLVIEDSSLSGPFGDDLFINRKRTFDASKKTIDCILQLAASKTPSSGLQIIGPLVISPGFGANVMKPIILKPDVQYLVIAGSLAGSGNLTIETEVWD